jgi:hypothetical protein
MDYGLLTHSIVISVFSKYPPLMELVFGSEGINHEEAKIMTS